MSTALSQATIQRSLDVMAGDRVPALLSPGYGQVTIRRTRRVPGPLSDYRSRAEHSRARSLHAQRNRRNRKRTQATRPARDVVSCKFFADVGPFMRGIGAALANLSDAFAGMGHAAGVLYDSYTLWDNASVAPTALDITHYDRPRTVEDDATSRDTRDCATSSGGRWSDLMAQIDDLIEEDQ